LGDAWYILKEREANCFIEYRNSRESSKIYSFRGHFSIEFYISTVTSLPSLKVTTISLLEWTVTESTVANMSGVNVSYEFPPILDGINERGLNF
jgi:hypothetical protein